MPEPSFHAAVLPRGPEGLVPEGGWKEGDPLVSPEGQAALQREVGRTQALDLAEKVARTEGTKAAEAVLGREKESKAGQLKAFKSFLWTLEELAGKDANAAADPAETRLTFRLYRLEDGGGVKPTATYQMAVSFSAAEALGLGDPDFEGRAQTWAERNGRFGRYQWRILGWAAGEQTLDTTYNLNTEAPAGYEPPKAAAPELPPEKPLDPMANLKEGLTLINLVKDTLGGGAAPKVDTDSIRSAARAEALMEADRDHRKELRSLEDRWEAKVEAAKTEAHARGMVDGRREAEDEWRPKVWELEQRITVGKEPSVIEEAVRMVGGPEVVASLAHAVIASMNTPKPAPTHPSRPVVALQTHPAPQAPPPPPATAAPAVQALPEPSRTEWREAIEKTEEALEIIGEHDDGSPETRKLREVLAAFVAQGQADGPMGAWWQAWRQFVGIAVNDVLAAVPQGEGEDIMDMNGMKALLVTRLGEGATDAAILAELDSLTTPEQRAEWRKALAWIPDVAAAEFIGGGQDPERIKGLLRAFQAGTGGEA